MITSQELNLLQKVVKRVASRWRDNSCYTVEDIESQFWVKILEVHPILKTLETDEDLEFMARRILKNYLSDIVRFHKRRPDTSIYSLYDNFQEVVESAFAEVSLSFTTESSTGYQSIAVSQLKEILVDWAQDEKPKIQRYINEVISPSAEILESWRERIASTRNAPSRSRLNNKDYIPPTVLAKLLGIHHKELYEFMWRLKVYLERMGYNLSVTLA